MHMTHQYFMQKCFIMQVLPVGYCLDPGYQAPSNYFLLIINNTSKKVYSSILSIFFHY